MLKLTNQGKVIGIVSAKGGVGKSTITANLGVALSMFNKKVLAMDANLSTASLGFHLGIMDPAVTLKDMFDYDSISKAIYTHSSGLDIIPGHHELPMSVVVDEIDKIKYLRKAPETNPHSYDYILLDAAPGLSDEAITTIKFSSYLLMVTNPDFPSVMTTLRQIKVANEYKKPIIGIVLNRTSKKHHQMSAKRVSQVLGLPVISSIPEDHKVQEAISHKTPVVIHAPYAKSSIAIKKLAARLIDKKYDPSFIKILKARLTRTNIQALEKSVEDRLTEMEEKFSRLETE